jgi:PAS domain-containing protein
MQWWRSSVYPRDAAEFKLAQLRRDWNHRKAARDHKGFAIPLALPLMRPDSIVAENLISTFAQHRQVLLKHAADVLCSDTTSPPPAERETKLSAILVSSLEELKVAEEELVERSAELIRLREEMELRIHNAHQLFDLAPACLLVTDMYGTILEANHACRLLLKRDLSELERQPFARFIPLDQRRPFREGLVRIATAEAVSDWRLKLVRPTDAPIHVSAMVRVAKTPEATTAARLFWSIRELDVASSRLEA